MPENWNVHNKRTILDLNKFLKVELHTIELPDGTVIDDWAWVITPHFANIILVLDDGRLLLFQQGKYGYEGDSYAPMGGYLEPDEDPLTAAKRELLEETGYEADEWHTLGNWVVDTNRGCGVAHAFLAIGGRKVASITADDLEAQTPVILTPEEAQTALFNGDIKGLPWSNAVAMALLKLQQTE